MKKVIFIITITAFAPFLFAQEGVRHEAKSFKVEGFAKTGERQWQVEGETAEMESDQIVFSKIKALLFQKGISVTLTADKGTYDKKTREVNLEGSVNAETSDGGSLTTDNALWSAETEQVWTDSLVTVSKDGIVSKGQGGRANPELKTATLKKNIIVKIPPATVITCDGPFDIYYEDKKAVFNNNVTVIDEGGQMFADELTAFFNPGSHEIERVLATGGVKVIRYKTAEGDFLNAPIGN